MADPFREAIRKTCQKVRQYLPFAYQEQSSQQIYKHILRLDQYRYAKHIALYQANNGEIHLNQLWRSAPLQGKYCYFPSLNDDKTLSFLPATPASLFQKNRFGIDEPDVDKSQAITPDQLDILFIPLVAFDKNGTRLGRGAGYYDRTLALSRPKLLIGVAYEFQCQSFIQPQHWDIALDVIITERTIYWPIKHPISSTRSTHV